MNIRGLIKFSLNDFPGRMACVIFVGGCNFRCGYCHNPHLVFDPESQPLVKEEEVYEFLKTRVNKLDGIVVSGGEPTLRKEFGEFAKNVKQLGFEIKMDTNGTNPQMIRNLHNDKLIDALGVDYKAPAHRYEEISGTCFSGAVKAVWETLSYAVESNLSIDVRTTIHQHLLSKEDIKLMRKELDDLGVRRWTLQQFNPVDLIDDDLCAKPTYSDEELVGIAKSCGENTHVRNLRGILID